MLNISLCFFCADRFTTYEVLGSLPAPEETAQALVIKGAESEGGATHKRRQSISHFFRRKFSRKKDCKIQVLNSSGTTIQHIHMRKFGVQCSPQALSA